MVELVLSARMNQLDRTGLPFGVLHVDIDNLDGILADHGHRVAQRVQQLVSTTLRRKSRDHDVVGHWDDSEYLAVYEKVGPEQLVDIACRIRGIIESVEAQARGGAVRPDISVGVAQAQPFDTTRSLVRRAIGRGRAGRC